MPADEDPIIGNAFYLTLEGIEIGYFRECSGLEIEVEIIESKEVDKTGRMVIRKLPGANKYTPVVMKKGQTTSPALFQKFAESLSNESMKGKRHSGFKRTTGSIVLKDVTGANDAAIYNFRNAWISKYKGGELNASSNNLAVEEITIIHEGMFRQK
jgi:phage tail-like protein